MSKTISVDPIETKIVLDPRLDARERPYVAMKSSAQTTWKRFEANGGGKSQNGVSFDCPPPNRETFISRWVWVEMQGSIKITHPNLAKVPDNTMALRHMPIQNAIVNNVQMNINESNLSVNSSNVMDALSRFDSFSQGHEQWSTTPWYPDNCADYQDLFQKISSPVGSYQDGVQGMLEPRGGFKGFELVGIVDAGLATAYSVYKFSVREPLFISPLCHGSSDRDDLGLIGITKFLVTLNYQNTLSRILSVDPVNFAGIGDITVRVNDQADATLQPQLTSPALVFQYFTPRANYKIPKTVHYSYYNLNEYSYNVGNVNAGATQAFNTNSLQISGYPQTIYVWCRPADADRGPTVPDLYGLISEMRINFQNKSGELSGAREFDLFDLASRNGYEASYNVWKSNGSVIAIDLSRGDLGLSDEDACPGVLRSQQIQISGTMQNLHGNALNYDVWVCFNQPGLFTITESGSYTSSFVVPERAVLNSKAEADDPLIIADMYADKGMMGGKSSVLSRIGNAAKSAVRFLDSKAGRKSASIAGDIGRLVPIVGDATVDLLEDLGPGALKLAKHLVGAGKARDLNDAYKKMVSGRGVIGAGVLGAGELTESKARSIIASISKNKQGGARAPRSKMASRLR